MIYLSYADRHQNRYLETISDTLESFIAWNQNTKNNMPPQK